MNTITTANTTLNAVISVNHMFVVTVKNEHWVEVYVVSATDADTAIVNALKLANNDPIFNMCMGGDFEFVETQPYEQYKSAWPQIEKYVEVTTERAGVEMLGGFKIEQYMNGERNPTLFVTPKG